jgi:AcrR family transcriptional regulator
MTLPQQTRIKIGSAERRERQRQDTRRTILEAATTIFEQSSLEGFSLRQVAEATGFTPTTIYLYFKDKEDLLFSVCAQGFAIFTASLVQARDAHSDALERLRSMARAYMEFGLSQPLHYQMMFTLRGGWLFRVPELTSMKHMGVELMGTQLTGKEPSDTGHSGDLTTRLHGNSYDLLLEVVQDAMRAGQLRLGNPEEATLQLWAGLHGIVSLTHSMNCEVVRWNHAQARHLGEFHVEATLRDLRA